MSTRRVPRRPSDIWKPPYDSGLRHQRRRATARARARPFGPRQTMPSGDCRGCPTRLRGTFWEEVGARLRDAGARGSAASRRSDGCKLRWRARPIGPRRTRSWAWRSSCTAILHSRFPISSAPADLDPGSASAHLNLAARVRRTRQVCGGPESGDRSASPRPRRAARRGPPQSPPEVGSASSQTCTWISRREPIGTGTEFRCIIRHRIVGGRLSSTSLACHDVDRGRHRSWSSCRREEYAMRRITRSELLLLVVLMTSRAFRRGADHGQQPARLREGRPGWRPARCHRHRDEPQHDHAVNRRHRRDRLLPPDQPAPGRVHRHRGAAGVLDLQARGHSAARGRELPGRHHAGARHARRDHHGHGRIAHAGSQQAGQRAQHRRRVPEADAACRPEELDRLPRADAWRPLADPSTTAAGDRCTSDTPRNTSRTSSSSKACRRATTTTSSSPTCRWGRT